ncbi:hypothetical protein NKDENANG_00080 [Candidatus Entotheonellaceae bacterium PAL068K]
MTRDERDRQLLQFFAVNHAPVLRLGDGMTGKAAASGETVRMKTDENETPFGKANAPFEPPPFFCMPMRLHDRLSGVLNLSKQGSGPSFTKVGFAVLTDAAGSYGFRSGQYPEDHRGERRDTLAAARPRS